VLALLETLACFARSPASPGALTADGEQRWLAADTNSPTGA
jgi:hypothetical protein